LLTDKPTNNKHSEAKTITLVDVNIVYGSPAVSPEQWWIQLIYT